MTKLCRFVKGEIKSQSDKGEIFGKVIRSTHESSSE